MSTQRPRSEESIFNAARKIADRAVRRSFIDRECEGDLQLQHRVESLLQVHDDDTEFLESPGCQIDLPSVATVTERPGSIVGQYRLVRELGEGGFGIVFEAEQLAPIKRNVALKILKPGMDTRCVVARFEAERQTLATMDHPNIAKVFDAGETTTGRPFFVMELVRGIPITKYCDRESLSVEQRLQLIIKVCHAVQHAHQKGVIHRDIKPSNVLVAEQDLIPSVKVIDFGIAKAIGPSSADETKRTRPSQLVGTPLYMSPEQAEYGSTDIDTRADVYALGVLTYELLTGSPPFDRERLKRVGFDEFQKIIRSEEPIKPSSHISTLDNRNPDTVTTHQIDRVRLSRLLRGDLDWIVMKCLEKDRDRRYESVSGLADDIGRFLDQEPVEAGPPALGYKLSKYLRKHRALLTTVGIISLVMAIATIFSAWQAVEATAAKRSEYLQKIQAQSEAKRADEERAIAVAVNNLFLFDILAQADIENQSSPNERNRDITVRELLDRAARRMRKEHSGLERVEGAIHSTLGQAYFGLGEHAEADEQLTEAWEIHRQRLGPEHADTLETELALAQLRIKRGKYDSARSLLDHVIESYETIHGKEHAATLRAMNILGLYHEARGEYPQAELVLSENLRIRRKLLTADHPEVLSSLHALSFLYLSQGRYAQVEPLAREAYEGRRKQLGMDHPSTLAVMTTLADSLALQGELGEAEELLRQALAIYEEKLGANNPGTLFVLNDLALLCERSGQMDEAEKLYERALAGHIEKLGPDHPQTLNVTNNLATLYASRNRMEKAEPLLKSILAAQRINPGVDHPDTILTLNNLAFLYQMMQQLEQAEPYAEEAVASGRKRFGLQHPTVQTIANNLVLIRLHLNKPAQCEDLLRDLLKAIEKEHGRESAQFATELSWLATCLIRQKKFSAAERHARECLTIREKFNPTAWPRYYTMVILGAAMSGQKKFDEAEPLLVDGIEGLKERSDSIPSHSKFTVLWSDEWLVEHRNEKKGSGANK